MDSCVVDVSKYYFRTVGSNTRTSLLLLLSSNAAHSSNSGATTTHIIIRGTRIHSNIKVESGSDIYVSDGALEIMR